MISKLDSLGETISDRSDKAGVLSMIVYLLAYTGDTRKMFKVYEEVIGLLKEIDQDDGEAKEIVLRNLMCSMAVAGDHEKALKMAKQTKQYDKDRDGLFFQISVLLAKTGYIDAAIDVSLLSASESVVGVRPGSAAGKVAVYLSMIGEIEKALSIANVIDDVPKSILLSQVAETLFVEQRREMALNLSKRMHAIAETITEDGIEKDRALSAVALTLAVAEDYGSAEEIEKKVVTLHKIQNYPTDKDRKDSLTTAIAKALAESGNAVKALELVDKIEDESVKVYVKSKVVRDLAKTGQRDRAREIANDLVSMEKKGIPISGQELIMALAWAGEVGLALKKVKGWKTGGLEEADILSDMALTLFVIGKKTESTRLANMALKVILKVTDRGTSSEEKHHSPEEGFVLIKIARAFASTNEFQKAIALVDSIKDTTSKIQTYGAVALFLFAVGKESEAMKYAEKAIALRNTVKHHDENLASLPEESIDSLMSELKMSEIEIVKMLPSQEYKQKQLSVGEEEMLSMAISSLPKEGLQKFQESEDNKLNQLIKERSFVSDGKKIEVPIQYVPYMIHDMIIHMAREWSQIGQHERALSLWIRALMTIYSFDTQTIARMEREHPFNRLFDELDMGGVSVGNAPPPSPSKRRSLFSILADGAPIIANIDQGQTLWKIYQAIMEIESWWEP